MQQRPQEWVDGEPTEALQQWAAMATKPEKPPRTNFRPEARWASDREFRGEVVGDCEVVIRGINGEWAIRNTPWRHLLLTMIRVCSTLWRPGSLALVAETEAPFRHQLREANHKADRLANSGRGGRRHRSMANPAWEWLRRRRAEGLGARVRVWFDGSVDKATGTSGLGFWVEAGCPHFGQNWRPLGFRRTG